MKSLNAHKEPYVRSRTKRFFAAQKQMAEDSKALMRLCEGRRRELLPGDMDGKGHKARHPIVL